MKSLNKGKLARFIVFSLHLCVVLYITQGWYRMGRAMLALNNHEQAAICFDEGMIHLQRVS